MKKKLSLLLVIMTIAMLLLSCGGNPIDGIWKVDGGTIDFDDSNRITTNDFFAEEEDYIGTYEFITDENEDSILVLKTADYGTEEYVYEFKGTNLELSKDDELVMTLAKSQRREGGIRIFIGTLLGYAVNIIGDYAFAIIIFTILLKIVLLPISIGQTKSTVKMQKVQPIVNKINEKYKHDKQKAQQKTMELYQKAKINPLAGCLPLIVNMVLLISFFRVLLYPDVYIYYQGASIVDAHPSILEGSFLWIKNLSQPDLLAKLPLFSNIIPESMAGTIPGIMPILTSLVTLFSFNSMASTQPSQQNNAMMKSMKYMMPVMFLVLGSKYPAALMLYWTVSSIFQMIQQPVIKKLVDKEVA
jgi:YidC/Oxa1 family membrane protein insertase